MKRIDPGFRAVLSASVLFFSVAAMSRDWPQFRGPNGDGCMAEGTLPLTWSETNNVCWKTAIPHSGWSTPVAMDGRVWLSAATEDGRDYYAYCLDAESGKMLFEKHLFHCDNPEPLGNSVNGYASPSAALEKGRVYIHFGSYGTACLGTTSGETLWKRDDMPCRHFRGPGSSAVLYEDLLILTFDGVDQQYLIALNKHTGKTVWKTDRKIEWNDLDENGQPKNQGDFRKAFATPLVINVNGEDLLISAASSTVLAYEPRTGRERWRVSHNGHSSSASPVFGKGMVVAATGYRTVALMAIRPDGAGDVTKSHVAWSYENKDVPTTPSPVVVGDLLFMLGNRGAVTCLDIKTGEVIWRERIGGNYIASLIHADGRIYCFSVTGKITVLRAGRVFEKLAETELNDGFMASPAVLDNALLLRTKTHLYRIEQ